MTPVAPRLKWHMLRQRKADPPFLRTNLVAALRAGAACEVDIVISADGHALCLHDRTLDRETNGHGRVADATRAAIEQLRQRGADGAVLDSAPLFIDELAATVCNIGVAAPGVVQLDVKAPARAFTAAALANLRAALGRNTDAYIASAYEWPAVQLLVDALPGLHAGFDPLAFYPRSFALDAAAFRAIAARTLTTAPRAAIYYLEAKLVLAALACDVDLVHAVTRGGAQVDAWTIDADRPQLQDVLRQLIDVGVQQITSNDPAALAPIVNAIMTS